MLPPGVGKSTTGLDPNLAGALAYLGGMVSGIVLLFIEKESRYVRFHAMQSTIAFLAVLLVHLILTATPIIGWVLIVPFILLVVALWVFLMYQALNGREYKLPYIGDVAERRLG